MIESNLERLKRIEREKWKLLYTLRAIVEIEQRRCSNEQKPEPKWIEEARELLLELEE